MWNLVEWQPGNEVALVPGIPSKMLWQEQKRQVFNSSKHNEILFDSKNLSKQFTLQVCYKSINYIKPAVVIIIKTYKILKISPSYKTQ
ncbi:hypothetical protein Nmel_000455 [Mimus melanotis]